MGSFFFQEGVRCMFRLPRPPLPPSLRRAALRGGCEIQCGPEVGRMLACAACALTSLQQLRSIRVLLWVWCSVGGEFTGARPFFSSHRQGCHPMLTLCAEGDCMYCMHVPFLLGDDHICFSSFL